LQAAICVSQITTTKVAVKTDLSQAAHVIPFRNSFGSPDSAIRNLSSNLSTAELIHRRVPWKTKEAVGNPTLE
jgi:hypothetical protein